MLTPHAHLLILQGAIVDSDQGLANIELAIVIRVSCYLGIEVKQIEKLRNKSRCTPNTVGYRKGSIF
jgi:uncharacterized tellurite resistance protein B-like protein